MFLHFKNFNPLFFSRTGLARGTTREDQMGMIFIRPMCLTFGLNFVTWYEFMDFYLCCANYEGSIIQPMICAYQIFLPVANHNSITADLERGDGASLFGQGQFF